jgi:acyl carrier protein
MSGDRLEALVAEILDIEHAVTDDTGSETESTWDSLAQLEILITVEEVFGVKFSAEEIANARSVGYIRQLIGERRSTA